MPINLWRVARLACYVLLLIAAAGENLLITVLAVIGIALEIAQYLWERHQHNTRAEK